jgi:hypothetical protein
LKTEILILLLKINKIQNYFLKGCIVRRDLKITLSGSTLHPPSSHPYPSMPEILKTSPCFKANVDEGFLGKF